MAETNYDATSDTGVQDSKQDKRPLHTFVTVVATVVIIVLILLLWRGCATYQERGVALLGGREIVEVEGLEKLDGSVAVWLRPDASIVEVLERNGLAGRRHTHLGEGTYVIDTAGENENDIVRRLDKDPGLHDAGFIYSE
ncbi:MAG: hypothetical protein KGZ89_02810 [Actinobacteria bacterium]|nr:hypothetical protein [Actinomycetota bacterium]